MKWTEDMIYDSGVHRSPLWLPQGYVLRAQYKIGRILGHGGFGITYLGYDLRNARPVAVKEYLPRDCALRRPGETAVTPLNAEEADTYRYGLDQFIREAELVSRFRHPSLVRMYEFLKANHTAYLIMQFVQGDVLSGILARRGNVPQQSAMDVIEALLEGLSQLHAQGVYHRDIKPANIYISSANTPILLDFGAARYALGQRSQSLTSVVAPGYSPFEQYSAKGTQGPWTDVYACGATLYEMVTGLVPPEAPDRLLGDTLQLAHQVDARVDPALSYVLDAALKVHPRDRIQSAQDFSDRLQEVGLRDATVMEVRPRAWPPEAPPGAVRKSGARRGRATEPTFEIPSGDAHSDRRIHLGVLLALPVLLGIVLLAIVMQSPLCKQVSEKIPILAHLPFSSGCELEETD